MVLAGVLLAGALAYANSLGGAFVFDDIAQISADALSGDAQPLLECLKNPRGVAACSLRLSYAIGQLRPAGYHLFNIAVHLLAALALFGVVRRGLRLPGPQPQIDEKWRARADLVATLTALLWVVHPLGTQAVTYVIQRAESMMALFYLLTLYGGLRDLERPSPGWKILSIGACLLGMCTKQVMITAPLTLLLIDRTLVSRSFVRALRARPLLYGGLLMCAGWLFVMLQFGQTIVATGGGAGLTTAGVTPREYFFSQGRSILDYLRLSLVPYPQCIDYYRRVASGAWAIVSTTIVFGVCAVGVGVMWVRRSPAWLLVALFFLILSPTSSFMPIADLEVEHRMYLPLALVLLGLVLLALRALQDRPVAPVVVGSLVAATALGVLTHLRNRDYSSAEHMWARVVRVAPTNPRAYYTLGTLLAKSGEPRRAIAWFEHALALRPDDADALSNLGMAYLQMGDVERALATFEGGLRRGVASDGLHLGMASVRVQLGDRAAARAELEQALAINPYNANAHANLGTLQAAEGQLGAAEEHLHRAAHLRPSLFAAHNGLGMVYLAEGRPREALTALQRAEALEPDNPLVRDNLARARAALAGVAGRSLPR
jgi:Flp pilus assembly protein TadD